jgi:hypothetical protein
VTPVLLLFSSNFNNRVVGLVLADHLLALADPREWLPRAVPKADLHPCLKASSATVARSPRTSKPKGLSNSSNS